MKKIIELTPEWVLEKLPHTMHADGKGNVTICTDSVTDSHWIDLALDTLEVRYESVCVGYDPDPKKQYFEVHWEFKIESIKDGCLALFNTWKVTDDANAHRLLADKQLLDSIELNSSKIKNIKS